MTKRNAVKEIGGKSASPILMASHVEPQMRQSATHAAIIPNETRQLFSRCGSDAVFIKRPRSVERIYRR